MRKRDGFCRGARLATSYRRSRGARGCGIGAFEEEEWNE